MPGVGGRLLLSMRSSTKGAAKHADNVLVSLDCKPTGNTSQSLLDDVPNEASQDVAIPELPQNLIPENLIALDWRRELVGKMIRSMTSLWLHLN